MHRFLFKSLLTFTLPLLLWSCQSPTATGPCEYTEEKFNMIIIDVIQKDDNENEFTVLVDFDGNVSYASETHTLEEIRNVKTNLDFVVNNHIKAGSIYKGVCHIKVEGSGDCEDEIWEWDNGFKK